MPLVPLATTYDLYFIILRHTSSFTLYSLENWYASYSCCRRKDVIVIDYWVCIRTHRMEVSSWDYWWFWVHVFRRVWFGDEDFNFLLHFVCVCVYVSMWCMHLISLCACTHRQETDVGNLSLPPSALLPWNRASSWRGSSLTRLMSYPFRCGPPVSVPQTLVLQQAQSGTAFSMGLEIPSQVLMFVCRVCAPSQRAVFLVSRVPFLTSVQVAFL